MSNFANAVEVINIGCFLLLVEKSLDVFLKEIAQLCDLLHYEKHYKLDETLYYIMSS